MIAAALQAAGVQVNGQDVTPEPEPMPEPEPAAPPVDPRWMAIMDKLNKASRPLHWVTISGTAKDRRIFVNLGHTDQRCDPYKITTWVDGWRVDLDGDPAEIDRTVARAIRVGNSINRHIDKLVKRLGLQPGGPTLFDNGHTNGGDL